MPHQCVRCGNFLEDGAKELLEGCSCGSKFFFFMSQKALDKVKNASSKLTREDRAQIEEDIKEIVDIKDDDSPVYLDIESVRVLKSGKYELNLVDLFKGAPLVYKYGNGKYVIDLASAFGEE
jgi:predicted  nucleic acid-binding Zn-ribbon protein